MDNNADPEISLNFQGKKWLLSSLLLELVLYELNHISSFLGLSLWGGSFVFDEAQLLQVVDDLSVPKTFLHFLAEFVEISLLLWIKKFECLPMLSIVVLQNLLEFEGVDIELEH